MITPGQRLVVDHQRRVQCQGTGQRHAPCHAAGQLTRPGIGSGQQADRVQLHLHQSTQHRFRQPGMRAQRQRHVLGHAQVGQQAVALQQHADVLAHLQQGAVAVRDVLAEQLHVAAHRAQLAGQRRQHRRLAAARRAQHRGDAAARHLQRDVAQDRAPAAVDAYVGQLHQGWRVRGHGGL
jgi:hypothetical protein